MHERTDIRQKLWAVIMALLCCTPCLTLFAEVTFEDVSAEVGVGGGGSAAWIDYDHDGWTDLQTDALYRNEGGKKFVRTGPGNDGNSWCDFDNDGHLDYFAGTGGQICFGNGDGTFDCQDVPERPMDVSLGGACLDMNGDGLVDIYCGGYEIWGKVAAYPDAIYTNMGNREFELTWKSEYPYPARGVTVADYNNDGATDVYVSNYRLRGNILWRGTLSGDFEFASTEAGVLGDSAHTIGSAFGDIDSDGLIDLFVGNFAHAGQQQSIFFRNLGAEQSFKFENKGTCGIVYQESYASPALSDYDNDGDLDLYFTTVYGHNHAKFFRNDGDWKFTEISGPVGLGGMPPTYQAAWADYDNDGDLDLATGGRLYRSNGVTGNWLKVNLQGNTAAQGGKVNRAAIGAQVRIQLGDRVLTRQVASATGQGNMNDLTMHFGLGEYKGPVELEISWPYTGGKQKFTAQSNSVVRVTKDE